ncbi:hypothetical protein HOC32_02985 [Candidatus Woesearchaeota archaeon]|jgi:hypothetical protein|nr:hypothetical protein [Candidatus Woesearchaeota archaeon]
MNFKLNWIKSIVSLVGGTILGIIVKFLIDAKLNYCPPDKNCLLILYSAGSTYLFIISGVVLVYIIWSLIQNK